MHKCSRIRRSKVFIFSSPSIQITFRRTEKILIKKDPLPLGWVHISKTWVRDFAIHLCLETDCFTTYLVFTYFEEQKQRKNQQSTLNASSFIKCTEGLLQIMSHRTERRIYSIINFPWKFYYLLGAYAKNWLMFNGANVKRELTAHQPTHTTLGIPLIGSVVARI